MRVLVVGGAGYIGSHMSKMLAEHGHEVIVCDDLSTGHLQAVRWGRLVRCHLSDAQTLEQVFTTNRIDAVMHFAAKSIVPESVAQPLLYYQNNVSETIALLSLMQRHGVDRFVFSSTAAIFGEPRETFIDETHPQKPISPYGRSKLMIEQILSDVAAASDIRAISLRYFNAAGADESAQIGESHNPETHLIPRLLRHAAGEPIQIGLFGTDYPTPDGTCVRDFIHVNDLCAAHLNSLKFLRDNKGFHAFNLGNGRGYSVRQVIRAAEDVIGRKLKVPEWERRPGDPAHLVASSDKAKEALDWTPGIPDIAGIIQSAWKWHLNPKYV